MENKTGGDITPENDVNEEVVVEENDDADALKEKLEKVSEQNKQLFARAKKAEGFELKDGQWTKPEVVEKPKVEDKVETEKPKEPSRSDELDLGQLALLRTEGIKSKEEVALFKEIMSETGKGVLDVLDSAYFKSRMTEHREAKESQDAIPKAKNRSGQQGTTDVDIALAEFKESGKLPEDFKTRSEVVKKVVASEKDSGMFTGPSVVSQQGKK